MSAASQCKPGRYFAVTGIAVSVILSGEIRAQQIFKSINENGVVEYTTIPPYL